MALGVVTLSDGEFVSAGERSVLAATFEGFRRALAHGGSWTVVVWALVLGSALFLLMVGLGYSVAGAPFVSHPLNSLTLRPETSGRLALTAVIALAYLALAPLPIGGICGTLAQAVLGKQVAWRTFWIMAARLYSRSWGFVLYSVLFGVALTLASAILVPMLHLVAYPVLYIGVLLTIPITIRMLGGLFLDELSFGESFRRSFRGRGFGAIIMVAIVSVAAVSLPLGLLEMLVPRVSVLPQVLLALAVGVLAPVVAPSWILALYRAVSLGE
jgi:hypothetical protein